MVPLWQSLPPWLLLGCWRPVGRPIVSGAVHAEGRNGGEPAQDVRQLLGPAKYQGAAGGDDFPEDRRIDAHGDAVPAPAASPYGGNTNTITPPGVPATVSGLAAGLYGDPAS